MLDSNGNLYGTTATGGAANDGTVFVLANGTGTITTLASFNGTNGAEPVAAVIMDSSGNLYGTTMNGGTVFELAKATGTITTLASVSMPDGALIMDSSGNLYGTESEGGTGNLGTVFEIINPGTTITIGGFPSPDTAGSAGTFTVTAKNADGTSDTAYTGTLHFTTTDRQAVLPADYTFRAADAGVHTFSATLKTAGTQSFTATDTVSGLIFASQSGITVKPAAASRLIIGGLPGVKHGVAFTFTVSLVDAYGNIATDCVGPVHFRSSDSTATLPANYTFTAADARQHTFVNQTILRKKGAQTLSPSPDRLGHAL